MSRKDLEEILGKGRSGVVIKDIDGSRAIARKIFSTGDFMAKLVNVFLTGSPNDYCYDEDAANAAHHKRNILADLCNYWFDGKLKVANSLGVEWNKKYKGYELKTEFVDGRHANLHHSFSREKDNELTDLLKNIMKPLQERLIEAGIDGLVWQAGKGNPVATNNFMIDKDGWKWIDLESGVPALFPMNPLSLPFYLKHSIKQTVKRKCDLFDDVDIGKLTAYLGRNQEDIKNKIGDKSYHRIMDNLAMLSEYQGKWKSKTRIQRTLLYHLKKENMTEEQSKHPYRWLAGYYSKLPFRAIAKGAKEAWNKIKSIEFKQTLENSWKFVSSQEYRLQSMKDYIESRINVWESRKHLDKKEANYLRNQLEGENISSYLNDFSVHMGIKVPVKALEYTVPPLLYATGVVDEVEAIVILSLSVAFSGSISRTLYTSLKMTTGKDKASKRALALAVGALPAAGNTAYPVQMVYSASPKDKQLAKFILYDTFTYMGGKVPIWGGPDTGVEHFFNRIPDLMIKRRTSLN